MEESAASVQARKFPCPQCGADLVWSPGTQNLRCPYCGFERSEQQEAAEVSERDLAEGLSERKLGWGTARKSYRCARCGAVESVPPEIAASACAFCGTPAVLEQGENPELLRPQGVLPFRVTRNQALNQFRTWLRSLWFRPSDLGQRAELAGMRGIYVPFFTFDAHTFTRWSAESGKRVGTGNSARIVWTPVSGTLEHRFDDLPIPASRGLESDLAREIEPFPTRELVAYEPNYLSGFLAEEYALTLEEAWRLAHQRMTATLEAACRAEVPGEHCRNLVLDTRFADEQFKTGLLPVWIAAYRYGDRSFRYVVNGATGKASGTAPWSWVKISIALAIAVTILLWVLS